MDAHDFLVKHGIEASFVAGGMSKENFLFNSFCSENETGGKDFHVLIGINLSGCPKEAAEALCNFVQSLGINSEKVLEIRSRYLAEPTYKILN